VTPPSSTASERLGRSSSGRPRWVSSHRVGSGPPLAWRGMPRSRRRPQPGGVATDLSARQPVRVPARPRTADVKGGLLPRRWVPDLLPRGEPLPRPASSRSSWVPPRPARMRCDGNGMKPFESTLEVYRVCRH
jgi:hypothetical protein